MLNATPEEMARAKELYDAMQTVKPDWDQLGEVTQSVWVDRVRAEESAEKGETK